MLGMFAKPDLSLPERAALMLTLVQASLMAYVKHGQWPNEDHRATVIGNWLERNGRKAGLMFRGKMSAAGDEMARYLVATLEPGDVRDMHLMLDRAQHLKAGEDPETTAQVHTLMRECERAIIAKGLAS
jgi:hypothetical protein